MVKRKDITKGKIIVIDDFEGGDSIVIKQGQYSIVFESKFPEHEIEIKCITEGETLEKKGLRLSYTLLEEGLENYEYVGIRRELKNTPEGEPTVLVMDYVLRDKRR